MRASGARVVAPRFVLVRSGVHRQRDEFARDVRAGLLDSPKRLDCRYFYDPDGSRLFEEICELPEYYLTRAEREILRERAGAVAARFPNGADVVEFGSGSAEKTGIVLAELAGRAKVRYLPVDISRSALEESAALLLAAHPTLTVEAVAGDYEEGFRLLAGPPDRPRLVLWLGSNIGNLDRTAAAAFLRRIAGHLAPEDRLMVGIDLRKARAVLEAAYDDARGVTARFNRNVLVRLNAELDADFDPEAFEHRARYDEAEGRIQMFLVSMSRHYVRLGRLDREVWFDAGEAIHTEDSYKYSLDEISALARSAGLHVEEQWFDGQHRFSVNLFRT